MAPHRSLAVVALVAVPAWHTSGSALTPAAPGLASPPRLRHCLGRPHGRRTSGPARGPSAARALPEGTPDAIQDLLNLPAGLGQFLPSIALPSVSQSVWDEVFRSLLQTVIAWGVPALVVGFVGRLIVGSSQREAARQRRLQRARVAPSKGGGAGGLLGMLGGGEEDDVGAPAEFLKVERLNDRFDSFAYSLEKATVSPAIALAAARRRDLQRRFGAEIGNLSDESIAGLVRAEERYRTRAKIASEVVEEIARNLRLNAIDAEATKPGEGQMPMAGLFLQGQSRNLSEALEASVAAEVDYLREASKALGPEATEERKGLSRLVADRPFVWDPMVAPFELPERLRSAGKKDETEDKTEAAAEDKTEAAAEDKAEAAAEDKEAGAEGVKVVKHMATRQPIWFVLEFFGDVRASQVAQLRQEVTAIVAHADASLGDGVVLVLNTGGGTVTGYGLAAAQLMRIKAAGLPLTICVEEVAASGGYMMACVADRLVASPFAVLGSIGVITDIPNVYDRLSREGVEFQTVTAGKFKRTLTPTKKVTPEDKAKTQEDIEAIFNLFRGFVKERRPTLDIDRVATGETWFGQDALERGLVDSLESSDDVLLGLRRGGAELYSVKYRNPKEGLLSGLLASTSPSVSSPLGSDGSDAPLGALGWLATRFLQTITGETANANGEAIAALKARPDLALRAQDLSAEAYRFEDERWLAERQRLGTGF